MPSHKNKIIIACAGAGKTTFLVEEALKLQSKNVLITTFTNENLEQIKSYFTQRIGYVPSNVTVMSWFSFLLQDGVRPYQNYLIDDSRIHSIYFEEGRPIYRKKTNYITPSGLIYSTKTAEFVYECNKLCNGRIIERLEKIYDYLFIDEMQDLAGYDLDFVLQLFRSKINIIAVGDPRQATFSTNASQKNSQYRKQNIVEWANIQENDGIVKIEEHNQSYRCNQAICDYASALFPQMRKTISKNNTQTGHDGIFFIPPDDVKNYVSRYHPIILRHSKKTDTFGLPAINIGASKGRTYDRILLFPTKRWVSYFESHDTSKAGDIIKLYIAITRAKYSVAIVRTQ